MNIKPQNQIRSKLTVLILVIILSHGIVAEATSTRFGAARLGICILIAAMDMYKIDNGFYPTEEQGLDALLFEPKIEPLPPNWRKGGYLDNAKQLMDPWGNRYIYRGTKDNNEFEIISYGSDGKMGGDGPNYDISSKEISLDKQDKNICFIRCLFR